MMVCSGRLPRRDAVGMAGLNAETAAAILQQDAGLVGDDRRAEGMRDRIDEGADVAVLVHDGDVDRRGIHRRRHVRQIEHAVHSDLADIFLGEFLGQDPRHVDIDLARDRRCAARASCRRSRAASASRWNRSTLSGANFVRSKRDRMFSITSMVMPGPFGGHCQTSWPLYMVPIGDVVSVVCPAKSSSVCRPPMPRRVSTMSSAMAPL